ncbi:MAG: 6-aminohexanoate hydrolase, partial [Spirochaetota bacterium]
TPDAPHLMPGVNPYSEWVLGYGYQWWIPENSDGEFLAIGIYGQAIYVYPRYNIVIVKTSAYPDYNKDGQAMELESIEVFRAIAKKI